jgi:hypothetical protein
MAATKTPLLWAGLLAGPVAWAVQLQAVYALAAWACDGGPAWPLHLASLACLLAAGGGAALSWRDWKAVGGWPGASEAAAVGRTRLLTVLGMMTGVLFALVILAQWIAVIVLPCGGRLPT